MLKTRLTYELLKTLSLSKLKRMGFSEKQILNKLSKLYLKEQRQLIVNENTGQTLSNALRKLKRGKYDQGVWIQTTALSNLKNDVKNLNNLSKYFGKDSFASKLLNQYQRGEINVYRLHNSMYSYVNNLQEYESKDITNSKIQALVDNYDPDEFEKYTYQSIKSMYE